MKHSNFLIFQIAVRMLNDQMMEVTRIFSDPKSADVIGHSNPFFSPSVNFTYVLLKYFMRTDPKSAKRLTAQLYFLRFWDLAKKLLVRC